MHVTPRYIVLMAGIVVLTVLCEACHGKSAADTDSTTLVGRDYNDPVVKYGFCRGTQTVEYVDKVPDTYNIYKRLTN